MSNTQKKKKIKPIVYREENWKFSTGPKSPFPKQICPRDKYRNLQRDLKERKPCEFWGTHQAMPFCCSDGQYSGLDGLCVPGNSGGLAWTEDEKRTVKNMACNTQKHSTAIWPLPNSPHWESLRKKHLYTILYICTHICMGPLRAQHLQITNCWSRFVSTCHFLHLPRWIWNTRPPRCAALRLLITSAEGRWGAGSLWPVTLLCSFKLLPLTGYRTWGKVSSPLTRSISQK